MQYTKVVSSNVDEIAHDGHDLFVRFKNGGLYKYRGVPRSVFERMLKAESVGKFLNAEVKPHYQFTKMPAGDDPDEAEIEEIWEKARSATVNAASPFDHIENPYPEGSTRADIFDNALRNCMVNEWS